MDKYAEVAVDAPIGDSRTFTYSIPFGICVYPGSIVEVPFGPRVLIGIVISVVDSSYVDNARRIIRLVYPKPILSIENIRLSVWISEYYMAGLFDSAAVMTPPGSILRSNRYVTLKNNVGDSENLTIPQLRIKEYLAAKGRAERGAISKSLGISSDNVLSGMIKLGLVEEYWESQRPKVGPKYVYYLDIQKSMLGTIEQSPNFFSKAPKQSALLEHITLQGGSVVLSDANRLFGSSATKSLESKGILKKRKVRQQRNPLPSNIYEPETPPTLNCDQSIALNKIRDAMDANTPKVFLLQGVTGSGKTEIYLRTLEYAMCEGKTGIVMVPELSLTPQTIDRFVRRFPKRVAVLHSGLSLGERYDEWWGIKNGDYGVVIGSRGAIFSPQPNLGVIVIDEEHEWTYKQRDNSPRYDAREVAVKLSELTGCVVIMGSATPDVVSKSRTERGQYELLELPDRVGPGPIDNLPVRLSMPKVNIVDLRDELKRGNRSIFSENLKTKIGAKLKLGEQIILYLNRRGSGGQVQCRDCGHMFRCGRCHMSLTYHGDSELLVCHNCNYKTSYPKSCSICGSKNVRHLGLGTQKVIEELDNTFPGLSTLRWDRDAASSKGSHEYMMNSFARGEAQVLVGTQMIAKGLHFPNVTLVGILCADIGLFLPDFRAGERVFELLCQVSGRTGRGSAGGEVIIQTYSPDHYAVKSAASQNYNMFYELEMAYRSELNLPPYSKLVRLIYSHTNNEGCENEAIRLAREISNQINILGLADVSIVGPSQAFPPKSRGRYRWHIILKGNEPRVAIKNLRMGQGWIIDVDPTSVT